MSSPAGRDYDAAGSGATCIRCIGDFQSLFALFANIALISLQAVVFEHNCSVHSFGTHHHLHLEVTPSELVFGGAAASSYHTRKPTKKFCSLICLLSILY